MVREWKQAKGALFNCLKSCHVEKDRLFCMAPERRTQGGSEFNRVETTRKEAELSLL